VEIWGRREGYDGSGFKLNIGKECSRGKRELNGTYDR
jgi:hypothetical protein